MSHDISTMVSKKHSTKNMTLYDLLDRFHLLNREDRLQLPNMTTVNTWAQIKGVSEQEISPNNMAMSYDSSSERNRTKKRTSTNFL